MLDNHRHRSKIDMVIGAGRSECVLACGDGMRDVANEI